MEASRRERTLKSTEERTKKRTGDNIKLLISDPEFQKNIREIRERLCIPLEGFASRQEIEDWFTWAAKEDDRLIESPEFAKNLKAIKKSLDSKVITLTEAEKQSYEAHLILPINYRTHAINELIQNFHLPKNYEFMLSGYLFDNSTTYLINNFAITPSKDRRSVEVAIYTRLTDDDLIQIKDHVNNYFGEGLPYIQSLNDIDTKLLIEKELDAKYEIDVANNTTYKMSHEDIAEKVFGDASRKKEIYETKRGLNRLRKARFGPRKSIAA